MPDSINITCPNCHTPFALDESLAGPMLAKIRADADNRIRTATAEIAEREKLLSEREASIETQFNQKIAAERLRIIDRERTNIRDELTPEIQAAKDRATNLQKQLTEARTAELALRNEKDQLVEREKNLELEVQRKVDGQRQTIQEKAMADAQEASRLKLREKDELIDRLKEQAEELKRKAEVGSQQSQGDALELDFEAALRQAFPQDLIEPVKAGVRGADVLQRVLGNMGRPVATILWETKRAQNWSGDWCAKAKKDAAEAKAEIAIIVSDIVPGGICDFGEYERVWIVRPTFAVPLSAVIRRGVIETAEARQGAIGKETNMERLYAYMVGPDFRAMLEGIALPFNEMQKELISEKNATIARWKRQDRRIERVLHSVAGLQGDLQGIAGSEMPVLPEFEASSDLGETS